jgi:hypothetical protein
MFHAGITGRQERLKNTWNSGGKVILGCGLGLILWMLIVPGLCLGWERNQTLLESWYGQMVKPFLVEGKVNTEHINQSLPGITHRLLTDCGSTIGYDDAGVPFSTTTHTIIDLGSQTVRWICRGWQLLFLLAVVVFCRVAIHQQRSGFLLGAEYALIFLGMLLLSERTWKHHAILRCLPIAVLCFAWAHQMLSYRAKLFVFMTMLLSIIFSFGPTLGDKKFQDDALAYGSHTIIFLSLFACCCLAIWQNRSGK